MIPQPDTDDAITFLRKMFPQGPWHLVATHPDKPGAEAVTFSIDEEEAAVAWVEERQGEMNLYFHVNQLRANASDIKARKSDIRAALFAHVDVDNPTPEVLERLQSYRPQPTVIVFSGGGYQAFWSFGAPVADCESVERINQILAHDLGGDNCHNIDRIMRLPGTVNMPNKKKRAAGRLPAIARLVEADWSRRYCPDDFPVAPDDGPAGPKGAVAAVTVLVATLDELPPAVSYATRKLIEGGDDPERPRGSDAPRYPSRSEAVFHAACELARAKCSEATIAGILLNPKFGIAESVLEKRNSKGYALRQARAAIAAVNDGWPDADKVGNPRPTMRNAVVAARRLGLRFGYDLFRQRKTVAGVLLEGHQGEISDDAVMMIRGLIIEGFGFDPKSEHVRDAINLLCLENASHPIREMLDGLKWDGVHRIDRWLADYLGAEDTPLNAAIGRILLIAAVRRVRQPGVKFDQIVVLEGRQGSGKSTTVKILAGPENHSDQEILTLDAKGQMEMLEGVWFQELGEVEGMNKTEVNKIKAFASRTVDRARMAYAYYSVARPRQAVFVGTTNDDKYLRDQSGNRRFWPVKTGVIDLKTLQRDRDQLLAEAAARETAGESIELPESLWEAAAVEQSARLEDDPWIDKIEEARPQLVGDTLRHYTSALLSDVLGIPPERQNQGHTKRLAVLMRKLGWASEKFRVGKQIVRGYEKPKPDGYEEQRPKPAL